MKIDIVPLHGLWHQPEDLDAVVVIDVLRSFTTASVAIDCGARAIYLSSGPAAAFALWRQRPHATLMGALGGGRMVPGFDYGNSPSAISQAPLKGQDIILSTAACDTFDFSLKLYRDPSAGHLRLAAEYAAQVALPSSAS